MGFSVSASAAIVFVGVLLAVGMFTTAASNGAERVGDARADRLDRSRAVANTGLNVSSVVWSPSVTTLTVGIDNTGARTLSVAEVDLLADNAYVSGYRTTVDGDDATDVWAPGEVLTMTVDSLGEKPARVTVVTGPGVAQSREVP